MIRVLVVEDSPVARDFLTYILSMNPDIHVVGTAKNGAESLEAVKKLKPDVITMDIHMPIMDGYEATKRIMETVPTPIVIVSGSMSVKEMSCTFKAMEAGALAVVYRPPGMNHKEFEAGNRELVRTVKRMSEIKVVRRIPRMQKAKESWYFTPSHRVKKESQIRMIAIGASTGGPPVLRKILSMLPSNLPVPVMIVQHIAAGFSEGFQSWLSGYSNIPLHFPENGTSLLPGHAYIAPDGFHMGVEKGPRIVLSDLPPEYGLRPSVSFLFRSAAEVFGSGAIGILLTGMGKDGANELKMMKDRGAITIAQDADSSVVHGMPGEAIKIGAAKHILSPEGISTLVTNLLANGTGEFK